jgi:hypothetical protein
MLTECKIVLSEVSPWEKYVVRLSLCYLVQCIYLEYVFDDVNGTLWIFVDVASGLGEL